jgi:hypothetical protein
MRFRFNIHQGFPIIGHLFCATWGLFWSDLVRRVGFTAKILTGG